jgi:hypothetical protein
MRDRKAFGHSARNVTSGDRVWPTCHPAQYSYQKEYTKHAFGRTQTWAPGNSHSATKRSQPTPHTLLRQPPHTRTRTDPASRARAHTHTHPTPPVERKTSQPKLSHARLSAHKAARAHVKFHLCAWVHVWVCVGGRVRACNASTALLTAV